MGQPYFHWEILWDICSLYRNFKQNNRNILVVKCEKVNRKSLALYLRREQNSCGRDAVCLFWLMARLDFRRFHQNRCVSNGSDGLHQTTFQPSSKYCLHFRTHVDSTVFPVSFFTGIQQRVLGMSTKYHNIQTSLTSTYIKCVEDMLQITRDFECHCCLILC